MHESGVIQKLLQIAFDEAERRGGRLRAIDVRLGVLAGGSPEHLRDHFEHELRRLGASEVELRIEEQPAYPGGVEITGIELS
ncbi:MAG: hydrogenase maturation nickel metallochaperone HypA [Myxococcales bacterium]|nr:hydrogenase maturation nickel metallochaperone HypA [Myxococcales bacterium]